MSTAAVRLREKVARYEPLLTEAGWQLHLTSNRNRARLEATHPSAAAIMITAVRGRRGVHHYVLHAQDPPGWFAVSRTALESFAHHLRLPPEAPRRKPRTKCRCAKRGTYPTRSRATAALLDVKVNKTLRESRKARERTVYRCPHDDRAWHLTSSASPRPQREAQK